MRLNGKPHSLRNIITFVNSLCLGVLYVSLIGITVLTVADTLLRFFDISIGGVPEVCTYLLVVLGFLGIAVTQAAQGHIEVTFLSDRFPKGVKYYVKQTIKILLILICLLFIYAGAVKAFSAYLSGESSWFGVHIFPVWFFRLVVPIGFSLLIIEFVLDMLRNRKGRIEGREDSKGEI